VRTSAGYAALSRPTRPIKLGQKIGLGWSPSQQAILSQRSFGFGNEPKEELEKIPFNFLYDFSCDDANCKGHKMSCTDWEMAQAYRSWRRRYGDNWEGKFRERFEAEMVEKFATHFYVDTLHQHPENWIIVGLFYPPKLEMNDLFGNLE
jgi:hypothetical protein